MGVPPTDPLPSPLGDEGAVIPPSETTNSADVTITEEMSDAQEPFAPPPHLAARFYRNRASARRKSSATSSRRNSLSSAHSRASSISRRRETVSGCQSNYVAQHLRRNSILESRKARLADRAAHAEQVRLRAALAKAAPRASVNNSEERALAAQIAKEKYLAKVAAACAEEVARAKRIAEEVKERKLAEETRARLEMEERHAEAEKRRAEYQRNLQARRARRADSIEKKLSTLEEVGDVDEEAIIDDTNIDALDAVPKPAKKSLSSEEATRRIQEQWRLYQRARLVRAYTDLDLRNCSTQNSFEDMSKVVADDATISATTCMLKHLGLQDDDDTAALNIRYFLSAFMITGYPVTVLNNKNGAQEQDLIQRSTDLINKIDTCVCRLARWNNYTPNPTRLESLSQAYSAYTSAFAAWRLQDSSVLIEGMVASFVELDAIWQTVKDDSRGEVASDYREGIRDNQVMLLSRIRKLAGPDRADSLIKKAIRESRKKRPKKRPTAEVRPRGVESSEAAIAPTSLESADESAVDEALPVDRSLESHSRDLTLTSLFTPMPSNRILTHELAINKDYRLEDTKSDLRDQMYRSLCNNMKAAFESGDGAPWTVSAAENVREKLLRMLKPGNSMHTFIAETMDLESINRQCQQGVFSYSGFFKFISNVLPKLCAPYRDAEMKALTEELDTSDVSLDSMIEKLFKVFKMVDKLSLDYTNFMIMNASSVLIQEASGYEHRMFEKDLEAGVITLEKTKTWWRTSYAQLAAEADRRDPESVRLASDRPSPQKVYTRALLTLSVEQGELDANQIPETLMLDIQRLQDIRRKIVRVTVIGAILLTAKNLLKRDSRSQWKNEAGRLWLLLSNEKYVGNGTEEVTTAQKAFSILETAQSMPQATKQRISGTINQFFSQAAALSGPSRSTSVRFSDPVLKVLFQRLRTHIFNRLNASTSSERVRAASSASEALASCGMPEFTAQIGTIVDMLEKIRDVDWKAHGMWYESIAREVGA